MALGRLRLTDGNVNFDIDNSHLHESGTVMLADSRLNTDWQEDFGTDQPVTTRLNAKGILSDAARKALNVGLQNILTGPVAVDADISGHRGQLLSADVSMDQAIGPGRGWACDGEFRAGRYRSR